MGFRRQNTRVGAAAVLALAFVVCSSGPHGGVVMVRAEDDAGEVEAAEAAVRADKEQRLAQLKKLAEAKRKADADAKRQAMNPPKLEDGDVLISGRTGVNQLVNGHFKLHNRVFHGRPSYLKQKATEKGPEAVDLAVWWSSGKWYVGLATEIGTDAAYAFVPSQAQLPDQANSVWSIWDGSKWLADPRIKCTGTGTRKLHVGTPHHQADDDDDYEEYVQERERRAKQEESYEDDDDYSSTVRPTTKSRGPNEPEPVPKAHEAPKRVKYHSTCPEGHAGCTAHNLCKTCPSECETCQNLRFTKKGQCGATDCYTCSHGYKHVQKHSDGRGKCESAGSGYTAYVLVGVVAVALLGFAIYMMVGSKAQPARRRGLLPSFG